MKISFILSLTLISLIGCKAAKTDLEHVDPTTKVTEGPSNGKFLFDAPDALATYDDIKGLWKGDVKRDGDMDTEERWFVGDNGELMFAASCTKAGVTGYALVRAPVSVYRDRIEVSQAFAYKAKITDEKGKLSFTCMVTLKGTILYKVDGYTLTLADPKRPSQKQTYTKVRDQLP